MACVLLEEEGEVVHRLMLRVRLGLRCSHGCSHRHLSSRHPLAIAGVSPPDVDSPQLHDGVLAK